MGVNRKFWIQIGKASHATHVYSAKTHNGKISCLFLRISVKYYTTFGDISVNLELLESARERIDSVPILVNVASKRVKQLNAGMRPYVKPLSQEEDNLDIALR